MDSKFFSQVIDVLEMLVDSRTVPTDLRQALLLQPAGTDPVAPTLVIDSIEAFVVWARRSARIGSSSHAAVQVLQKLRRFCWDTNWRLIIVSDHDPTRSRLSQDQSLRATSDCHMKLRRIDESRVRLTVLKLPTYSAVQPIDLNW